MTHEEIVDALVSSALTERRTGWLSDISEAEYDEDSMSIVLTDAGWPVGSIDLSQLAGVIERLIPSAP